VRSFLGGVIECDRLSLGKCDQFLRVGGGDCVGKRLEERSFL